MNFVNLLYQIQKGSASTETQAPDTIIIPSNKQLYEIDLTTREIHGPDTLSVQGDHYADTVYFLVDRYYDNMDLAQTNCVVQYIANGQSFVYAVPFCDITTYEGKMIIPWAISASATEVSGKIKYFVRFYLVEGAFNPDAPSEAEDAHFIYSLNTTVATSTILRTLSQNEFAEGYFKQEDTVLELPERYFELVSIFAQMVDNSTIYWNEASTS